MIARVWVVPALACVALLGGAPEAQAQSSSASKSQASPAKKRTPAKATPDAHDHSAHAVGHDHGADDKSIPPYHASARAAMPFPKTLPPETFPRPLLQKVYRIAQEIPGVLAQQPCYCRCNRVGHKGLLDCHRDSHSAG
jgi:hypothetical protein